METQSRGVCGVCCVSWRGGSRALGRCAPHNGCFTAPSTLAGCQQLELPSATLASLTTRSYADDVHYEVIFL